MSTGFKQEMPPPGGYQNINIYRIMSSKMFHSSTFVVATLVGMLYSVFYYKRRRVYMGKLTVERFDTFNSLEPLLLAEQDRAYLRQLRHNRDIERDLMKNVPDWKVGTLWGMPVFKTLVDGTLPAPHEAEYYAHRPLWDQFEYHLPHMWT